MTSLAREFIRSTSVTLDRLLAGVGCSSSAIHPDRVGILAGRAEALAKLRPPLVDSVATTTDRELMTTHHE
jgi:hypothetical protein